MEIIKTLVWVIEIISALLVVVLVLLQHGKGADAGATFGSSGGSGSLFGATGSSNFLSKTTAVLATVFFVSTFALVLLFSHSERHDVGVMAGATSKTNLEKAAIPTSTNIKLNTSTPKALNASGTSARDASAGLKNQIPQ